MCSKYGFCVIMSEGIIDLHPMIMLLVCHEMYVMRQCRATRKLSDWRGASEISAGPTGVGGLVVD